MKVKSAECQVAVYFPHSKPMDLTTAPATSSLCPLDRFAPAKGETRIFQQYISDRFCTHLISIALQQALHVDPLPDRLLYSG